MIYEAVEQAKDFLLAKTGGAPDVAIVMGSGLSALDEILRSETRIPYAEIPHFPIPHVAGHAGHAVVGNAGRLKVVVFEGRVHYYEGGTMDDVTFCARVVGRSGAKVLLLTNAAGAVNPAFSRGQIMLIADHINLMACNPLTGPNEDRWGPRFVDQSAVYDSRLKDELRAAAGSCDVSMVEGVYAALSGPTYETPAEVRYLRTIGADAVGMSTVPEAIVARHMGVRVAGLSILTNVAGGDAEPVDHKEVLTLTAGMHARFSLLLQRFLEAHAG